MSSVLSCHFVSSQDISEPDFKDIGSSSPIRVTFSVLLPPLVPLRRQTIDKMMELLSERYQQHEEVL